MECSQCGTTLPEAAKFCPQCATPVGSAAGRPTPAVQQGVGVVKHSEAAVGSLQGRGPVHVSGQQINNYTVAPEDRDDPAALRQAYLHRVLEQT